MGGLFKRHVATLARKEGKPWHAVLYQAEAKWNSSYVSKLRMGVPNDWNYQNFDRLIARLYEKEPIRMNALYSIGRGFSERDLAPIFKYKPGDSVMVSMRTISKIGSVSKHSAMYFKIPHKHFFLLFTVQQALQRVA